MNFISQSDQEKIREAIRLVEQKTSGELVTVITPESDSYEFIPYMWSAIIALFGAAIIVVADPTVPHNFLVSGQIVVFILLTYLLRLPSFKHRFVTKSLGHKRARRFAREQFFAQNVHHTENRSGILIFVSVAERYVEILADQGINDKIDPTQWEAIVGQFVRDVKAEKTGDGFITAINACGTLLAEHFPVNSDDKNELPNHLIIL